MCFRSAVIFLLLSTTLISQTLAFEVAAIVREINGEQGVAVVFANGQQRNVIIADKVKTLDEQGKELRGGFSNGTDTMAHSFQCLQIGRDVVVRLECAAAKQLALLTISASERSQTKFSCMISLQ
ncbi:MAG: hypothetical protein OSA98_05055 [Rubripirellula sp.]|nr:hypothetical protein [Rubripirellula sp.]